MKLASFWTAVLFLLYHGKYGVLSSNQCISLEALMNETIADWGKEDGGDQRQQQQQKKSRSLSGCQIFDSCSGIECTGNFGGDLQHSIIYGLDLNSFCSLNSTFAFSWNFGHRQRISKVYNLTSPGEDKLDVSAWKDKDGQTMAEEISVLTTLRNYSDNYPTSFTIQVSLKVSPGTTFDLFPRCRLVFDPCTPPGEDGAGGISWTNDGVKYSNTTMAAPVVRVDTGRTCSPNVMGGCRDNEACMSYGADSSHHCFCFDGFDVDAEGVCGVSRPKKPYEGNVAWGIVGGVACTVVIAVAFVVIVRRHCRSSRRYNEFDLTTSCDPSSPDPPMLEA